MRGASGDVFADVAADAVLGAGVGGLLSGAGMRLEGMGALVSGGALAYTVAGLSVGVIVVIIVGMAVKR